MTEDCPATSEDGRPCCYGAGHAIESHLWAKTGAELQAGSDAYVGIKPTREERLAADRLEAVTTIAMALPTIAMDGTAAHAARCAVDEINRLREAASGQAETCPHWMPLTGPHCQGCDDLRDGLEEVVVDHDDEAGICARTRCGEPLTAADEVVTTPEGPQYHRDCWEDMLDGIGAL